jgi:hypothetical protein
MTHARAERTVWALEALVPLEIHRMSGWAPEDRTAVGRRVLRMLHADTGTGGAELVVGGATAGRELGWLSTALAVLAYQPGGVNLAGQHWCTDHQECQAAERYAAEHPLPDPEPVRPVEVVLVPGVSV